MKGETKLLPGFNILCKMKITQRTFFFNVLGKETCGFSNKNLRNLMKVLQAAFKKTCANPDF